MTINLIYEENIRRINSEKKIPINQDKLQTVYLQTDFTLLYTQKLYPIYHK